MIFQITCLLVEVIPKSPLANSLAKPFEEDISVLSLAEINAKIQSQIVKGFCFKTENDTRFVCTAEQLAAYFFAQNTSQTHANSQTEKTILQNIIEIIWDETAKYTKALGFNFHIFTSLDKDFYEDLHIPDMISNIFTLSNMGMDFLSEIDEDNKLKISTSI